MFMVQKAVKANTGKCWIAPALIIIGIYMLDYNKTLNPPKINYRWGKA